MRKTAGFQLIEVTFSWFENDMTMKRPFAGAFFYAGMLIRTGKRLNS